MSKLFFQDFLVQRTKSHQERRKLVRTLEEADRASERKGNETMLDELRINRQRHEKQLADLQAKNLQLLEQIAQNEIERSNLEFELGAARVKIETLQRLQSNQQAMTEQHFHGLQSQQEEKLQLERANQLIQQQLRHKEVELARLEEKFNALESSYGTRRASYEESMKQLSAELGKERAENGRLQEELRQLGSENRSLQNQLRKADQKNQAKHSQKNTMLSELQTQFEGLEAENTRLKQELAQSGSNQREFEKAIKTLKIERKVLADANQCFKNKINSLELELQTKFNQINSQEQQISEKTQIIQQLESIAFGLKQSAEEGKLNTNQTLYQYQQLMQECDQLEKQIGRLEQDNDVIRKQYENIDLENSQLRSENARCKSQLATLLRENDKLHEENSGLSGEIANLNLRVQELQSYALDFQKELKDYMDQQNQINKQRSMQNSQMINQRNSYISVNKNSEESTGNQSPLSTMTNTTANQLKRIVKKQCVDGQTPQSFTGNSTENTKRHQQRMDLSASRMNSERACNEEINSFNNKENSLQQLKDKYYALRNRIYEQKK